MIGERLSKLRINHNMTQEEFAEYMDVSRQAVSKWELDKTLPDVNKLLKISDLFQVSLDYLLKGTEENIGKSLEEAEEKNVFAEAGEAEKRVAEVDEAGESEDETEIASNVRNGRIHISLKISILLVGILLAGAILILVKCLSCQVWDKTRSDKTLVKVDKIYEQISLAEVSSYGEDGAEVTRTVLLDTKDVRDGDYIYCYINTATGKISVNYELSTLLVIMSVCIILIFILILLVRELKKNEEK